MHKIIPFRLGRITYNKTPDNTKDVVSFIGPVPPCPTCNNYGEYETEEGFLRGCNPCNSRLLPFINAEGKRDYIDWGETIEKRPDGLHKIVSVE